MNERQREITKLVYDKGRISVRELAGELFVTEMTIRRDLTELEKSGYIKRYRGGAIPVQTEGNLPAKERVFVEEEEKRALAKKASGYLRDNCSVFIDSSTTCIYIIPHLAEFSGIRLFTNSIGALLNASRYHIPCTLLGGDYYERDRCNIGATAILEGSNINVDVMFFSTLGISHNGIISDTDEAQCAVRRSVMQNADKIVCLMEQGKFGKKYLHTLCRADEITAVIS